MTRAHAESLTIALQLLSEAGYTYAHANTRAVESLVRSLVSGEQVVVSRAEIEAAKDIARYAADHLNGQPVTHQLGSAILRFEFLETGNAEGILTDRQRAER
jgi:hypothetical protein